MDKYYHFWSDDPLKETQLETLLRDSYRGVLSFVMLSPNHGYCLASSDLAETLEVIVPLIASDFGINLTVLISHANDLLAQMALKKAATLHQERCTYLGDLLLDDLIRGNRSLVPEALKSFRSIPHDEMITAQAFVSCGLNATLASKKLYVHRNTFNYRLKKFIDLTGLDIRDFHNASFFILVSRLLLEN